ncbi:hypothetical protein [Kitasatospora sp. NPDC087315]|uniref:hypothetical protein n=1 Tax=Kitasatospora sp. NPDC087315 TaxID=3364069 RepID=UPI0037F72840
MSDEQTLTGDSSSPEAVPADPAQAIRAEIQREYAGRLALAEVRAQAAIAGVTVLADYYDPNCFLSEDGTTNTEVIRELIEKERANQAARAFPELQGAGYHRGTAPKPATVSLDARHR